MAYRFGLLRVVRVPIPVVVVGNVVAGGAGKTPVVMALAQHLLNRGQRVGLISRGYGRKGQDCLEVMSSDTAERCGDEPLLMKRRLNLPVFVARDRGQAALALLQAHPETQVIVSDDGLQHPGLACDVEIGLFDDTGLANGFLLPAGPLREPWPRHLDLALSTNPQTGSGQYRVERSLAKFARSRDGNSASLESLQGRPMIAIAAIAHPEQFFSMLREAGLMLSQTLGLADHNDFSSFSWSKDENAELIFTEKDATKIWAIHGRGWAVPLCLSIEQGFFEDFDRLINARLSSRQEMISDAGHG